MSAMASGVKLLVSASSIAVCRNTPFPPPVTATRAPSGVCATNTPISANSEAGWRNFMYAARCGLGKRTAVMSSPSSSAVANMP